MPEWWEWWEIEPPEWGPESEDEPEAEDDLDYLDDMDHMLSEEGRSWNSDFEDQRADTYWEGGW